WAAVARAGARERLAVARCALAAAESAQAGAERRLGDVRELDRLQRRFADAQARAEQLHARVDEQRDLEERL
ncbi:hypothetical protein G3I28_10740, partial [Streptomyces sp. SID10116]|nr:hypothetical protein [Streptomyces sp. SID10116]